MDDQRLLIESRRKRRTTIVGALAIALSIALLVNVHLWSEATRDHTDLTQSYLVGYALAPLCVALVIALVAIAFPGRNWFRFLLAYSTVLMLAVPAQFLRRATFMRESAIELEKRKTLGSIRYRTDGVLRETQRLVRTLEETPPLSARSLSSPEMLATTENRLSSLVALSNMLDELATAETRVFATPSHAQRQKQAALRRKRQRSRELYLATRAVLQYLRTRWGEWELDRSSMRAVFSDANAQKGFDRLAAVVSERASIVRTGSDVRVNRR